MEVDGPEGGEADGGEAEGEGGSESGAVPPSLIDVVVPEGCFPGMVFAVSVEGTTFNVTVPYGVSPGEMITVEEPAGGGSTPPIEVEGTIAAASVDTATPPPAAAAHASSHPDMLDNDEEALRDQAWCEQTLREEALREQEEADAAIAHYEGGGGEGGGGEGGGAEEPHGDGSIGEEAAGGGEGGEDSAAGVEARATEGAASKADAMALWCLDEAALKRVCRANQVHCSSKLSSKREREDELIERLDSVWRHGRPGPCPRCKSMVHVLSDDDGLRLECRHYNMKRVATTALSRHIVGDSVRFEPCGLCHAPNPHGPRLTMIEV